MLPKVLFLAFFFVHSSLIIIYLRTLLSGLTSFPNLWNTFLTASMSFFGHSTGTLKSNIFTTDFIIFSQICSLFMFPNLRICFDSFLLEHLRPALSILPLSCCSQLPPFLHPLCHYSSYYLYSVSGQDWKVFLINLLAFPFPNLFYILDNSS